MQWLLEISEQRNSDPNVVYHAMALFDQMLILKVIPNESLQLVAATGYLLASKLRETVPITPTELETFTYYVYTEQDIKQFEMLMVVCVEWDLDSVVTPCQFLQPMASFILCIDIVGTMVESAVGVLQKCVGSEQLCGVKASLLAAASLLYTLACLAVSSQAHNVFRLCSQRLIEFTGESMNNLLTIVNKIEECLSSNASMQTASSSSIATTSTVSNCDNNNYVTNSDNYNVYGADYYSSDNLTTSTTEENLSANSYQQASTHSGGYNASVTSITSNVTPPKVGSNGDEEESEQITPLGVQDVIPF